MRRRGRSRIAFGAATIAVALTLASASIQPTEAAWSEAEYLTSGITAATLPSPTGATCAPSSVLLLGLQSVRLTWSSPQSGSQRVQIQRGASTGTDRQGTTGSAIVQTGATGGTYQYEAVYDTAKLLGLIDLANLLGGSYTIRIYNGAGSDWVSAPVTFNLNVILLGLGSTCQAV